MKRLFNDKVVLGLIILELFQYWGANYNGNLLEQITEGFIFFLPGILILFVIKILHKKINNNVIVVITAVVYPFVVWYPILSVLKAFNTYAIYDLTLMILLGCFAYRIFKYGTFLKPLPGLE